MPSRDMLREAAHDFAHAAEFLSEHEWYNGRNGGDDVDRYCIWTVLTKVHFDYDRPYDSVVWYGDLLAEGCGVKFISDVFDVNDANSKEWAVAKLREIAATLLAKAT